MKTLTIDLNDAAFQIELLPERCPQTLAKLKDHMPFKTELHYAKIAGEEIMGVMPFNAPLENSLKVSQAKAGMLVFWPERHLLCLYYGQMQEEAASISLLGYLKDDVDRFVIAGEQVRQEQGHRLHYGSFYDKKPNEPISVIMPKFGTLVPFEYKIWERPPEEILQLASREGIMRPAGPLLYAEADTHAFHEFIAKSVGNLPAEKEALSLFSAFFCLHLEAFHNKMEGWYLLPETASAVKAYLNSLSKASDVKAFSRLLQNLLLFVGRLNYWLDALIPWDSFNEQMKGNPIRV